jgi:hypothetical protein
MSCKSLLDCGSNNRPCQMAAAKNVCNALNAANQPQNHACTLLAKLP